MPSAAKTTICCFAPARSSRFANLPEIVLGYRQGSIDLRKRLRSRWMWCRCAGRYLNGAGRLRVGVVEAVEGLPRCLAVAAHADAAWLRSRYRGAQRARNCGNGGRYGTRCHERQLPAMVVWPAPDYRTVAASVRDLFRFLGPGSRKIPCADGSSPA